MKLQTTYPSNNYPIYVEHGAIDHISTYIDQFDQSFILIDEHVNQYFADKFDDILSYENVHKVIIPAGEKTKTFEQYQETLEYILSHHVTRIQQLLLLVVVQLVILLGLLRRHFYEAFILYKCQRLY